MQTLTLLQSAGFPIGDYADALTRAAISPSPLDSFEHLPADLNSLRVVLVDGAIGGSGRSVSLDARTAVVGVGLAEQPLWLTEESLYFGLPARPSTPALRAGA